MDIFDKIFRRPEMMAYAEGVVAPMETPEVINATETAPEAVEAPAEAPTMEVEVPTNGDKVENVEVSIEYAEKMCNKFCEDASGMIDALEAGATAVIEDGAIKTGTVEVLPESDKVSDGIVGLGEVNSGRIIPETAAQDDDGAYED